MRLLDLLPGSRHVSDLGLDRASDVDVWSSARDQGFAVVTKDGDFGTVRGFPPDVVWIRHGNCTTADIERLLRAHAAVIVALGGSPDDGIVIIH